MKKVIMFVLVFSMLFCGTFSAIHVSAEESSENETEYLDYEPAYTPMDRIGQNIGNRAIIGDDDRTDVDDVTVSPYCKIVFVRSFFYYEDQVFAVRSTGFIVGPDLIVMSGHALFREFEIGDDIIYLTAGKCFVFLETEGETSSVQDAESIEIYVPDEYTDTDNDDRAYYDWGYIIVDEPVGHTQGWFGFGTISSTKSVTVAGYPENCPEEYVEPGGDNYSYDMYKGTGRAMAHPYNSELLVRHDVDTGVGQSGAPIYDASQIVWGIHVRGLTDVDGNGISENCNVGIRINSEIFQLLRTKKQEGIDKWD